MSELTLTLLRLAFLAVLWLFVLSAVQVIRTDLLGTRINQRPQTAQPAAGRLGRRGRGRAAAPAPAPAPAATRTAPARSRRAPSKLVVTDGSLKGTTVTLSGQQITIGRAQDSTIVVDDDYASSRHARVFPDGSGQWYVEDLGSTNGTYLDRTKVSEPTPVPLGVPIRVGKTVLELRK